jgi:hypothetical protein
MARSGFLTTAYLMKSSGLITATPLSVSAQVKVGTLATLQFVFQLQNNGSADGKNCFTLYVASGNTVRAFTGSAAANDYADTTGTISDTTSFHQVGGVWSSATSRKAYLDGVASTANTTNLTPSGINQATIGVNKPSSGPALPFTGSIAEVGLWNVALSDAEMAMLGAGMSPLGVRLDALVDYWPLIGVYSPEIDRMSNANVMSLTGAPTQAAHARVFRPKRRRV